ncbi:MAG: hypothetical protein V4438_03875 [Patescibacteria group bacterium]
MKTTTVDLSQIKNTEIKNWDPEASGLKKGITAELWVTSFPSRGTRLDVDLIFATSRKDIEQDPINAVMGAIRFEAFPAVILTADQLCEVEEEETASSYILTHIALRKAVLKVKKAKRGWTIWLSLTPNGRATPQAVYRRNVARTFFGKFAA